MAPKRRMPTRANPDSSDLPPVDPRESVGDSSAAPDVAHLARGMHQMQQSIDRLVDLFSRQPPPQPFVPVSIQISDSTTYSDVLDQALRLEFRVKASQSRRHSAKRSR